MNPEAKKGSQWRLTLWVAIALFVLVLLVPAFQLVRITDRGAVPVRDRAGNEIGRVFIEDKTKDSFGLSYAIAGVSAFQIWIVWKLRSEEK